MQSQLREQTHCNLCGHAVGRQLLYQASGYPILRCPECGLVFVDQSVLSGNLASEIYTERYFEGGMNDGYVEYRASEEILRSQAKRTIRRLMRYQPGGRLLDVGCAYGFFLEEAREQFEVEGIEISEYAATEARKRGLNVRCGDLIEAPLAPSSYDVISFFDCIEHLVDPHTYLCKAHQLLKANGIIAITTGDISSVYARLSGKRWRLMTPPQHLFFFSQKTMAAILRKDGFEILEVRHPWKLVPWRLLLYQISPRLQAALGPIGSLPIGLRVNLFDAMFVVARKL
jgi:SAM-dependent methyltransferase